MAHNFRSKGNSSKKWQQQKEQREENEPEKDQDVDLSTPLMQEFKQFQLELDAKYDKYERLVKHSRDVTIESKRIIFLLHRIKKEEDKANILTEAGSRLDHLEKNLLKNIAKELVNEDIYQYARAISPGIQEFVEASTFYHYEKQKELISLEALVEEVEKKIMTGMDLPSELRTVAKQVVQPTDYILGLADLTGELMRKCIMAIGAGQMEMPFELCTFLRQMHDAFVSVGNQGPREVTRKLNTLKQSLSKVETTCYTLQVRGSEIPKHMLVDVFTRDSRHYHGEMENAED